MDSLYGSHPGASFVLKGSFKSVQDMVASFKKGSNYKNVWYNEFCIIDTTNKNDKNNGKIYKRGLNYQNDMGGALYVGQIVGPSSGTPYFSLDTLEETKKFGTMPLPENSYRKVPTGKDSTGKYITAESGTPALFDFNTGNSSLVPGKYEEDGAAKYNDSIKYTWVNIRQDDADADSWFYVGFQYPYHVIDYNIHDVSPYDREGNRLENASNIERTDDKTHPFFEEWNLGIPHGIKGDSIRHLRVITPTSSDIIYSPKAITINPSTGRAVLGKAGYEGQEDDIANKRQIVVFDYFIFDDKMVPTPAIIYVGDFNVISKVQVDEDGTLRVSFTHNSESAFSRKIQWIKNIELTNGNGKDGGHFTVNYNNGSPAFERDLTWIKDVHIDEEGNVIYTFAGTNNGTLPSNGIVKAEHQVKWINSTELNKDTGVFNIAFNDKTTYSNTLDWVKDISIDKDGKGTITLHHTDAAIGDVTTKAKLKYITNATMSADGIITLFFNTGDTATIKNSSNTDVFKLKTIDNVSLSSDLAADKRIGIKFNTEGSVQYIGAPINIIQDVVVWPSNFHLLVLYSDPSHRKTIKENGQAVLPKGTKEEDWVSNEIVKTFNPSAEYGVNIFWRDYGPVKDDNGVLVGFNLTSEDIGGGEILDWLNKNYPNGIDENQTDPLTGAKLPSATRQKIVTYQPNAASGKNDKEFYAFDYRKGKSSWYYLGTLSDNGTRDVKMLNENEISSVAIGSVNAKGLLFIKNTMTYSDKGLPSYWSYNGETE